MCVFVYIARLKTSIDTNLPLKDKKIKILSHNSSCKRGLLFWLHRRVPKEPAPTADSALKY